MSSTAKKTAHLYLIPLPIAEGMLHTLAAEIYTHTLQIQHYVVENARTARRFIKALHPDLDISGYAFLEIDKHQGVDINMYKSWLTKGLSIGIMSEAGCPGIADPGAEIVALGHQYQAIVTPLVGPSSITLALMASGLNGQSFAFAGYLPIKEPERSKRIKELEVHSGKEHQTQAFIETPYRNNGLLADLLKNCLPHTRLCLALHMTAENSYIKTMTVSEWRKNTPNLEKAPAIFLILANK